MSGNYADGSSERNQNSEVSGHKKATANNQMKDIKLLPIAEGICRVGR